MPLSLSLLANLQQVFVHFLLYNSFACADVPSAPCVLLPAAGMAGSYRTIKATWGPIALQAQLQRQQRQQQQQDSAGPASAAGDVAPGSGGAAVAAAAAGGGAAMQAGGDCLDAVGLQEVVLAAVGFVEAQATARAGGAAAQVRAEASGLAAPRVQGCCCCVCSVQRFALAL
jgi:hypothetical protein